MTFSKPDLMSLSRYAAKEANLFFASDTHLPRPLLFSIHSV
jgi:hypothetical protein